MACVIRQSAEVVRETRRAVQHRTRRRLTSSTYLWRCWHFPTERRPTHHCGTVHHPTRAQLSLSRASVYYRNMGTCHFLKFCAGTPRQWLCPSSKWRNGNSELPKAVPIKIVLRPQECTKIVCSGGHLRHFPNHLVGWELRRGKPLPRTPLQSPVYVPVMLDADR